jgi:hypothetical protein
LDTTTVLLLDVDPQSLHFEDDAVVFSSHLPQSRRVATPECLHSYLLPLLWPGFYTTPRDSNRNNHGDFMRGRTPFAVMEAHLS